MKINSTTVLIILTALIVAVGAYWYFFINVSTEPPLSTNVATSPSETRFQTLISQLGPITFSASIFEDARFLALQDLTTVISAEPAGRIDPFAPISANAVTRTPAH